MNKIIIALVVGVFLIPVAASAAQFRSSDERLNITEDLAGNLYAASGDVAINGNVRGDLFVAGGQVDVAGAVTNDLFAAGGNVQINGLVGGDLRVAGGNIKINGKVAGELLVFGGSIAVSDKAVITGGVEVFGGQVVLGGESGAVTARVGQLQIDKTAHVRGDLNYTSKEDAKIADGSRIEGAVKKMTLPVEAKPSKGGMFALFVGGSLFGMIINLVALLLLIYFLPAKSQSLVKDFRAKFGINLLTGFIFLVVTPLAAIALLASVLGLPLGLGVLLLYPIAIYFGKLAGTLTIGSWIQSMWDKKSGMKADWPAAVIGLFAVFLIGLVPIIGGVILALAFLTGLGAAARYDWQLLQKLRQSKQI